MPLSASKPATQATFLKVVDEVAPLMVVHHTASKHHKKPGPRWDWDMMTGTFANNPVLDDLIDKASQPARGLTWWIRNVHPQDRSRIMDAMSRCTEQRLPTLQYEYRLRCRSGNYIPVRDKVFITYVAGFPVRMRGFTAMVE